MITETYKKGAKLKFTATPKDNTWRFVKWIDQDKKVLGLEPVLTHTCNNNIQITAVFEKITEEVKTHNIVSSIEPIEGGMVNISNSIEIK